MLERLRGSTAPMAALQLRVLGGAAARVPRDATAFAHRESRILVNVGAIFDDPAEAPVARGVGRGHGRRAAPGRRRART